MSKSTSFLPAWRDDVPAAGTYRSIFKYDPHKFKHPSRAWFEMFKTEFGMTDDDFKKRRPGGDWIRMSADLIGENAAIIISDSGPGLPRQALDHLFEPFRGSNRPGGAGLGLAIAQELMAAQGGALALIHTGESGTSFRLTLPGSLVSQAVA